MGPNRLVQEDRMVQIYPNWSNMVQNQTKKGPNGSGITRSPGVVFKEVGGGGGDMLVWFGSPSVIWALTIQYIATIEAFKII